MEKLIEFTTGDGRTILVETWDETEGRVTRGGYAAGMVEQAQRTFEEAVGCIQPAVQVLIDQLVSLAHRPTEESVEFGVNLRADAGAFIAKAGGAANFTVKLTWEDPDQD